VARRYFDPSAWPHIPPLLGNGSPILRDKHSEPVLELDGNLCDALVSLTTGASVMVQFSFKQLDKSRNTSRHELDTDKLSGLSVILYGPAKMGDLVGDYLLECRLYLQTPQSCEYQVPYINPHLLFSEDDPIIMTTDLDLDAMTVQDQKCHLLPDLLASLEKRRYI